MPLKKWGLISTLVQSKGALDTKLSDHQPLIAFGVFSWNIWCPGTRGGLSEDIGTNPLRLRKILEFLNDYDFSDIFVIVLQEVPYDDVFIQDLTEVLEQHFFSIVAKDPTQGERFQLLTFAKFSFYTDTRVSVAVAVDDRISSHDRHFDQPQIRDWFHKLLAEVPAQQGRLSLVLLKEYRTYLIHMHLKYNKGGNHQNDLDRIIGAIFEIIEKSNFQIILVGDSNVPLQNYVFPSHPKGNITVASRTASPLTRNTGNLVMTQRGPVASYVDMIARFANANTFFENPFPILDSFHIDSAAILPVPTWQPDQSVQACSSCFQLFTFLIRRHHCRICGCIFCGSCTSGSGESRYCHRCRATYKNFLDFVPKAKT